MLVRVQGLEKSFKPDVFRPAKKALKEVAFSLPKGSATGFIGVNGAGKTTTLKCLLGFLSPDQGQIEFDSGRQNFDQFRKYLGYLPERPYFYDFLTTVEFLKFHWELSGGGPGFVDRKNEVLRKVDLLQTGDKRLRAFSKGMLQRIGLAQALLRRPELLILDEPMSGLDPDGRWLVKEILREERGRGTTLFFSSHLLADMEELCDRLLVIEDGQILFEGLQTEFRPESNQSLEKTFAQVRASHRQTSGRGPT
jgi:ABC-2 type transport system ATP-binding protein